MRTTSSPAVTTPSTSCRSTVQSVVSAGSGTKVAVKSPLESISSRAESASSPTNSGTWTQHAHGRSSPRDPLSGRGLLIHRAGSRVVDLRTKLDHVPGVFESRGGVVDGLTRHIGGFAGRVNVMSAPDSASPEGLWFPTVQRVGSLGSSGSKVTPKPSSSRVEAAVSAISPVTSGTSTRSSSTGNSRAARRAGSRAPHVRRRLSTPDDRASHQCAGEDRPSGGGHAGKFPGPAFARQVPRAIGASRPRTARRGGVTSNGGGARWQGKSPRAGPRCNDDGGA